MIHYIYSCFINDPSAGSPTERILPETLFPYKRSPLPAFPLAISSLAALLSKRGRLYVKLLGTPSLTVCEPFTTTLVTWLRIVQSSKIITIQQGITPSACQELVVVVVVVVLNLLNAVLAGFRISPQFERVAAIISYILVIDISCLHLDTPLWFIVACDHPFRLQRLTVFW